MKTILLVLSISILAIAAGNSQTFVEEISLSCNDTAHVGNLGYPTWNVAEIANRPAYGHAMLLGDFIPANLLQYIAPPCFAGRDTVVVACARATQITCDTGVYVFLVGCPEVIEPVFAREVDCRDSIYMPYLSGWAAPVLIGQALHGHARIVLEPADGAGVMYMPEPGFEGMDYVKVGLFGGQDTALFLFQVYCNLISGKSLPAVQQPFFYPNPAGERLYIATEMENPGFRLFDLWGRSLPVTAQREGTMWRVDIKSIPSGAYVITAGNAQEGHAQVRFVKLE